MKLKNAIKYMWCNVKVGVGCWMKLAGERIVHSVYKPADFRDSMDEIADA